MSHRPLFPTTTAGLTLADALRALAAMNASWVVDVGEPEGAGWISGTALRTAASGPFHDLLSRIGERARTTDRRTIAASFALRFGWSSVLAIAPYLEFRCVPDMSLENVSLKFKASTFFERAAMHQARGVVTADDPRAGDAGVSAVPDDDALLRVLRAMLVTQAEPIVEALHEWSGFALAGTWGMLASAWAAHFTSLGGEPRDQRTILPTIDGFFAGDDIVARMRPRLHPVTWQDTTHVFQRRASCCRWYLLPQGDLCASCPLVSQQERVERNLAWMKKQLEAPRSSSGHT